MKKILSLMLVLLLVMSMLVGCGKKADDTVTLTMIESLTSPDRTILLRGMLDKFEEQNPNIKVELISPPFKNL